MDLREIDSGNPNRHPWEIARARCLSLLPSGDARGIADIGSGDMFFTRWLGDRLKAAVFAVDINYRQSGQVGDIVWCRDIDEVGVGSLELITMLDVLEHVEDDFVFLTHAVSRLKPGGQIILTVPAHRYLFSEHDVFLQHRRRYSRKDLAGLLAKADLAVKDLFFFFSSLYMIRIFQALAQRIGIIRKVSVGVGAWSYAPSHWLTRSLANVLEADFVLGRSLHRMGMDLPGLSLCAICIKKPV